MLFKLKLLIRRKVQCSFKLRVTCSFRQSWFPTKLKINVRCALIIAKFWFETTNVYVSNTSLTHLQCKLFLAFSFWTLPFLLLLVSSSVGSQVYEGQMVNLTCTLGHPHDPDLEVKWKHRSFSTLPSSPFLSFPEVTMKHSGQWTCELMKNKKKLTDAVLPLKIGKRSERKRERVMHAQ